MPLSLPPSIPRSLARSLLRNNIIPPTHQPGAPPRINKQLLTLLHLLLPNLLLPIDLGQDVRGREELQGVAQADGDAVVGDASEGRVRDGETLGLGAQAHNRFDLVRLVGGGRHDQQAGEQVRGDAVRGGDVFRAADGASAAVRGEDDDRGDGGFEGAVEVGEGFDVEHVDLIQGGGVGSGGGVWEGS